MMFALPSPAQSSYPVLCMTSLLASDGLVLAPSGCSTRLLHPPLFLFVLLSASGRSS